MSSTDPYRIDRFNGSVNRFGGSITIQKLKREELIQVVSYQLGPFNNGYNTIKSGFNGRVGMEVLKDLNTRIH